ncbi:MAG: hypothetical protein HY707_08105 [Ignavibacteriae bacterium]|nr:hypothetical protein [Ignavibacteriota bacterium]
MNQTEIRCAQSCKELCSAIEIALEHEKQAILRYGMFRDQCTYPEVKTMLNELIIRKQKEIQLIEQTKSLLKTKFEVLDQIREGFEM